MRPWADADRHRALRDHIGHLWRGEVCEIVRCGGCGTRAASPFVAGDSRFYELAFGHTDRYPADKWEFRSGLDHLRVKGEIPHDLQVLEVGAGRGSFLRQLIRAGVEPAGLAAVEYSVPGRRALADLGLGHVAGDELSWSAPPGPWMGRFDAVALFQVLEHLDDLDSKLLFLRSCLRPGGLLLIAVPNWRRISFNERNGALLDQPPNHISCFTREGMEALAERTGYAMSSWDVQPLDRFHDLGYLHFSRYLRRSQRQRTLAARSYAVSNRRARQLAAGGYMLATSAGALRYLPRLRDGSSALAVLRPLAGSTADTAA